MVFTLTFDDLWTYSLRKSTIEYQEIIFMDFKCTKDMPIAEKYVYNSFFLLLQYIEWILQKGGAVFKSQTCLDFRHYRKSFQLFRNHSRNTGKTAGM